ncbi:hypothetical protein [Trebonia sp.]|uniref:PspA-associated protein PspAA n=1 Tax=Trebonia sp. TaxID=2767075 RepID=UPI00262E36B1|nr:hypothetical protein [Trebonia sp.]
MIVRILGEGQFLVDDDVAAKLSTLDAALDAAVEKGDEPAFKAALDASVHLVRESGARVPDDTFVTADVILPFSDATIAEVRQLLADGRIPGDSVGQP